MTDRSLRLLAREDIVGQLERARAGERRRDESVQLAAGGELGHDPFEHAVADERPRHILGSEPARARSTTRATSGAERTSSAASSIRPRQARAAARRKGAARPAASARPGRV